MAAQLSPAAIWSIGVVVVLVAGTVAAILCINYLLNLSPKVWVCDAQKGCVQTRSPGKAISFAIESNCVGSCAFSCKSVAAGCTRVLGGAFGSCDWAKQNCNKQTK
jgi:hypothetical protein